MSLLCLLAGGWAQVVRESTDPSTIKSVESELPNYGTKFCSSNLRAVISETVQTVVCRYHLIH
eukprot:scaffold6591_cov112-Skeletonema_dohrnii-CCMP3373.AAC.4